MKKLVLILWAMMVALTQAEEMTPESIYEKARVETVDRCKAAIEHGHAGQAVGDALCAMQVSPEKTRKELGDYLMARGDFLGPFGDTPITEEEREVLKAAEIKRCLDKMAGGAPLTKEESALINAAQIPGPGAADPNGPTIEEQATAIGNVLLLALCVCTPPWLIGGLIGWALRKRRRANGVS